MKENNIDIARRILFEDNHLIIVNKLPSEIVQGDKTGDQPLSDTVKTYIAAKYNKPGEVFLGVIHRLDRPVSGACAFARTSKALTRMNEALKAHRLQKTYWAVVKNAPPETSAHLVHYLKRNQEKNKAFAYTNPVKDSQKAELTYELIAHSDQYYLLKINLLTGRHHQIRCQLATIGCPIKGDLKYGYPRSNPDASIHLHAVELTFEHPVRKEMITLTAQPPIDPLWDYFRNLIPAVHDK